MSTRKDARAVLWAIAFPYGRERTVGEIRDRIRREEAWAAAADEPSVKEGHQLVADAYKAHLKKLQAKNVSGHGSEESELSTK